MAGQKSSAQIVEEIQRMKSVSFGFGFFGPFLSGTDLIDKLCLLKDAICNELETTGESYILNIIIKAKGAPLYQIYACLWARFSNLELEQFSTVINVEKSALLIYYYKEYKLSQDQLDEFQKMANDAKKTWQKKKTAEEKQKSLEEEKKSAARKQEQERINLIKKEQQRIRTETNTAVEKILSEAGREAEEIIQKALDNISDTGQIIASGDENNEENKEEEMDQSDFSCADSQVKNDDSDSDRSIEQESEQTETGSSQEKNTVNHPPEGEECSQGADYEAMNPSETVSEAEGNQLTEDYKSEEECPSTVELSSDADGTSSETNSIALIINSESYGYQTEMKQTLSSIQHQTEEAMAGIEEKISQQLDAEIEKLTSLLSDIYQHVDEERKRPLNDFYNSLSELTEKTVNSEVENPREWLTSFSTEILKLLRKLELAINAFGIDIYAPERGDEYDEDKQTASNETIPDSPVVFRCEQPGFTDHKSGDIMDEGRRTAQVYLISKSLLERGWSQK